MGVSIDSHAIWLYALSIVRVIMAYPAMRTIMNVLLVMIIGGFVFWAVWQLICIFWLPMQIVGDVQTIMGGARSLINHVGKIFPGDEDAG